MPTQAEMPRRSPLLYHVSNSWTDDLPVCKHTGAGYSTNQVYRDDGHKQEAHPFEDTSFHRSSDDSSIFLYGVFDGHDGNKAATFALQQLAAELLFGHFNRKTTDEEVKEGLRQAFFAVEKNYLKSVDGKVAERTSLLYKMSEGLTPFEKQKLECLNSELSCGTTAVIALVMDGRLFVANIGNSRALLCRTDENEVLRVVQLSVDHDTTNEDEILRLLNLGLVVNKGSRLGNQENTRCLGNYLVKGGYKEYDVLSGAAEEPIIAEPEIHGPIHLDKSCRFLLLMSDGLYKSLEEAKGTDQVNKEIAQMLDSEFRVQSTLMGVAQGVVDRVVRLHHDAYMNNPNLGPRDDITLLVRNFNHPLPHSATIQGFGQVLTGSDESSTTTSDSVQRPKTHIPAYVDFSDFHKNIEAAKANGTLPKKLYF